MIQLPASSAFAGNWKVRRIVMFTLTLYCMILVPAIVFSGIETEAATWAVQGSFALFGVIVLVYVLGATWEDVAKIVHGGKNDAGVCDSVGDIVPE